jgi:type I restriction enzyme S subunit
MEVKPGYKQTEVGVIPEDWEVKPFTQVTDLITCGIAATPDYVPESRGYPFLSSTNVKEGRIVWAGYKHISAALHRQLYRNNPPKRGDILYSRVGTFGEAAVVDADFEFSVYVSLTLIKPGKSLHSYFLMQLLNSNAYKQRAKDQIYLGGGVGNLNVDVVRRYPIVAPPLPEQRAIAEALSDVDGLLGGLDRLIAKKRDLKQAAMQQLLTGQTRLPGFHGEWVPLNMADNSTLKARIGWQGLTTAEYLKTGDYLLVTGTDFIDGRIAWSSCCFVAAARYTQDRNIQLRSKDILLTKDGTIGKVAYVDHLPGPATLNSGVFVIRPKDEAYEPHFFYYILTSRIFEEFLNKLAAGSTISHLYQKDFVTFSFLVPPTIPEQTAIAEVLREMDGELAVLEQRREKTRALKQALMQELLTGRTRLI